jgi:hypothetical protein
MVFELIIPELGKKPKRVKDIIISVLIDEYPLTAKRIFNILNKRYGISITFQAVNKSIKILISQGVLQKRGRDLSINKKWVFELRDFVETLQDKCFSERALPSKIGEVGDTRIYRFNNLLDQDKFWCKLNEKWILEKNEKDKRPTTWWGSHCWWVVGQLDNEDRLVQQMIKYKTHTYWLCKGNTFLDKLASKYYVGKYLHYKSGDKDSDPSIYIMAMGDYVFESKYPPNILKKLEQFYRKVRKAEDMNLNKIMRILRQKADIKMTVMNNEILANQLRENILSRFKKIQ